MAEVLPLSAFDRSGAVVLQTAGAAGAPRWLGFSNPREVLIALEPGDVRPVLEAVERAVARGAYAAGFLSYEAAAGLDVAFQTHPRGRLPLAWFGLYDGAAEVALPTDPADAARFAVGPWQASMTAETYDGALARIKAYIRAGDTYQVNFTLRLHAPFRGDPLAFFAVLCRAQQAQHCAYVDTGEHVLCSVSPELFFALDGERLVSRPMKGTLDRGLSFDDDCARQARLQRSAKDRAENVMIVDMVRNDMGRVATAGSVEVLSLFDVERYPTVFQMTSTVQSATRASLTGIVAALFPCASITGAPKVRTMQIITELEPAPRGIYCGSIGYVAPGRKAEFNVAIRTVAIERAAGTAEYGVGGGVVWDSDAAGEFAECVTKAAVLTAHMPSFELLESILWEPGTGYFLLEEHLLRLRNSAAYFGFAVDVDAVRDQLRALAAHLAGPAKVRLRAAQEGRLALDSAPLEDRRGGGAWRVGFAARPVDARDRFLYHKTTHRAVYHAARASRPECDDVLLWNDKGEVTESTIANVVVELKGARVTPPVACGLLAGVFRNWLLARGELQEAIVTRAELQQAERIYLINSVRRWVPAVWG